jgi:small subunit ribosomal protein S18
MILLGALRPRLETKSYMSEDISKAAVAEVLKDKDGDISSKSRARRKKRVSILTLNKIEIVDYKDTALLRKFINDRGKMLSSRQTGTTAKQQRQVAIAVKRAREMALLPFVVTEMNTERREPRRSEGYVHEEISATPAVIAKSAPAAEAPAAE